MASYRALDIGMDPSSLGLVAAAFAILPVLLGSAALMAVASIALALIGTAVALLALVAVLGLAQLTFVVANQTLVGSRSPTESYDSRYGYLSFVASFGQLIGPASIAIRRPRS